MAENVAVRPMSNLFPWTDNQSGLDHYLSRVEQKVVAFSVQAPATAVTEKHLLGKFDHPVTLKQVRVSLTKDGAGAGNTVTIDILQSSTTCIGTTKPDFVTADAVNTPEDANLAQGTSDVTIPADTDVFLSLASSGTITAGHKVSGFMLVRADNP